MVADNPNIPIPPRRTQTADTQMDLGVIRLSTRLKFLRKANKLTLRDAERHTGISNGYLSQLESGKIESPSVWVINTLAKYYNVTIDHLISVTTV